MDNKNTPFPQNATPIDDVHSSTGMTPLQLARMGIIPRYSSPVYGHWYDNADISQGIQRRYGMPEAPAQPMSHAEALDHVGTDDTGLTELANLHGLKPAVQDNEGSPVSWNVPDVRQLYFVQNYPQETVSPDDAANTLGIHSSDLEQFAKEHGYSPYTFTSGSYKPHYTALQLQGIRSKLKEMREKYVRENMYGAPTV
jgi:hypothetical protein